MAYRVVITDKAEADIESVLIWFHDQQAVEAGNRWFTQLMVKLTTLENHPQRCVLAAESEQVGQDIRELLFGKRHYKYRILFQVSSDDRVTILRVRHSSRDSIFGDDLT